MPPQDEQRDLVLDPLQFVDVLDETKGQITVYVGPTRTTLSPNDKSVKYSLEKGFERCQLEQAVQSFVIAKENEYIVLRNPAAEGGRSHPPSGTNSPMAELNQGRKVVIEGPVQFALWPGQAAEVIRGHLLRSDQFLVASVYNEDAANASIRAGETTIRPQAQSKGEVSQTADAESVSGEKGIAGAEEIQTSASVEAGTSSILHADRKLTVGQRLVIKGTDVSFFIPPTGIEVLPESPGRFVCQAVTLERLEYCILRDENGKKRYEVGPQVVFPEPTEVFVVETVEGMPSKKFRVIELNDDMGLHLKVIAPYTDDEGIVHEVGEELFITGNKAKIYIPREEHAIIKYGEELIHYATAVTPGEGRYVLDKMTGRVNLVKGPLMLLPDPRIEVTANRVLSDRECWLMYPGNQAALEHNRRLAQQMARREEEIQEAVPVTEALRAVAEPLLGADTFTRRTKYTQPRSITLDTKYAGAVTVSIFTGYAVNVVSKSGKRRVVAGPATLLLEFDESLESVSLSGGTPKSRDNTVETVYLRVRNNTVSDIVCAVTQDQAEVEIRVQYCVNFAGDPEKWFDVEDYTGLLSERMRSIIRSVVKQHGIEIFYQNYAQIIRDIVLGTPGDDSKRRGHTFPENGMVVYDLDIGVRITDPHLERALRDAAHESVSTALAQATERRRTEAELASEEMAREVAGAKAKTAKAKTAYQRQGLEQQLVIALSQVRLESESAKSRIVAQRSQQEALAEINEMELVRERARFDLEVGQAKAKLEQYKEKLDAEVKAITAQAGAVSPELAEAIKFFGEAKFAGELAKELGLLAVYRGGDIVTIFQNIMMGVPALKPVFEALSKRATEGEKQ